MKARIVFGLSLFVVGICIVLRSLGSHHVRTLQTVGLMAVVTCLAAAYAIPKSSTKNKPQD
jgi:hypothetical protein